MFEELLDVVYSMRSVSLPGCLHYPGLNVELLQDRKFVGVKGFMVRITAIVLDVMAHLRVIIDIASCCYEYRQIGIQQ